MRAFFQLAARAALSNLGRLKRPYKLLLALTYRCNFRCRYCRSWERAPSRELTVGEVEAFFRSRKGFSWVDLTGGEITLRADLPEILETITRCCRRLFLLHFPTNAYLTEQVLRAAGVVKRSKVPRFIVTVSLDGPPPVHDRLKGVEGSWARAVETFIRLKRTGIETYLGMTLFPENSGLIPQTIRSVRDRFPSLRENDFHFNLAHRSFFYNSPANRLELPGDIVPILERLASRYSRGLKPQHYLERNYILQARRFIRSGVCPLPCLALSSSCFIDPGGVVYPCCSYDLPLGNLVEEGFDFDRIWSGAKATALQREIIAGRCPQCWTPCEAYQTILGNIIPPRRRRNLIPAGGLPSR